MSAFKRYSCINKNGGFSWNRTNDTKIFSLVLCQLSYEAILAVRTGLEPVISRVTGERDNHYTNEPWLREMDLNQRPLGYEPNELPDCSIPRYEIKIWRRKRDSNPCADFSTSRFSRPVPSTRLGYSST